METVPSTRLEARVSQVDGGVSALAGEVWYEYINSDASAMPVALPSSATSGEGGDGSDPRGEGDFDPNGERLIFRPGAGLDGWTPMREVLSSRASTSSTEQAAASGNAVADELASSHVVTDVQHGIHVRHDPVTGGLSGLPEGWTGLLPEGCAPNSRAHGSLPPELLPVAVAGPGERLTDQMIVGTPFNVSKWRPQFGLPLEACETTNVNGYEIPSILVLLWRTIKDNDGLLEEGIFRLAPDATACDALKQALNTDGEALHRIGSDSDPHVLANLIKVFFRSLPERLMVGISTEQIVACSESGAACMKLLQSFSPQRQGLLLWLLEMMADVAELKDRNRMTERAVATVVAPNLYMEPADLTDPMAALHYSQHMAKFVCELLLHFVAVRVQVRVRSGSVAQPPGVSAPDGPPPRSSSGSDGPSRSSMSETSAFC